MVQDMGMMPQADQENEGAEAENQAGSTVIEIVIAADGSITVEKETGEQEAAEGTGGEEPTEAAPISVKSIDEAMDVVKQIYNSIQQTPEDQKSAAIADQKQGYNQM